MRRIPYQVTAMTVLVMVACSREPKVPTAPGIRPSADQVQVGDNCVYGGDDFVPAEYPLNECDLADSGFGDTTAHFGIEDLAEVHPELGIPFKVVYFLHEARFTGSGSGYRIAASQFPSIDPDSNDYFADISSFGIELLKELDGSEIIGFIGACPDSSVYSANRCAEYAFSGVGEGTSLHDEPRICIWNETVGTSGSAAQFCDSKVEGGSGIPSILNGLPTAKFFGIEDSSSANAAYWTFDADSSSDPEDSTLSYQWEISDGTITGTTTNHILHHTFDSTGTYIVRLRVTEGDGGLDVKKATIVVTLPQPNQPPTADFSSDCTGLACDFTDLSSDSDGSIASWEWHFGDGGSASAQNPSHTYSAAGTYVVSLQVHDDDAATATHPKLDTVTVASIPPVFVDLGGDELLSMNKQCTWSADVSGGTGTYSYNWKRDGTSVSTNSTYTGNTGTSSFVLKLTVTSGGVSSSDQIDITLISGTIPCS